ncbi:MAG: hypothetical protein ACRENE_32970 [Polyangiaceae bacterium]
MRAALLNPTGAIAWAAMAFAPLSVGCTGTVAGSPGGGAGTSADAESAVTQALVLVERTVATEGTRAAASARFARVTAGVTPAETLRALGASLDLPSPGSCEGIRTAPEAPPASGATGTSGATFVELLDMGRVSLETTGGTTSLVPRQLPYVTDVVTGTVYARAVEAPALPAAAPYVIHVAGAGEVAGFDVVGLAPQDASDIAIAQETSPGEIAASGASVDFSWRVGQAGPSGTAAAGSDSDVLYVEVQPAGVRCTLGTASVSGASAGYASHASITTSLLDDAGSLVVHRVHAQPLDALPQPGTRGVDGGELRFDFARVVAYTRP